MDLKIELARIRREFGNKPGELLLEKQNTWEQIAKIEMEAM
jgi:hypothetical protein